MEQVQKDNPIVYLYRGRNLTAYTRVVGVEVYPDGVVRLSHAAFLAGGLTWCATCSTGSGSRA